MDAEFRVLHVRSSSGLYGAEYVVLGLIPALARLGVRSTLLALDNQHLARQPLFERARLLGVPAERLPCGSRFDLATIRALRRALVQERDTLLHVHDYKSARMAWLARGRRAVPIVATSHGHYPTTRGLRLYQRIEVWLMRRFDAVCIVSARMQPQLASAGVPSERIHLIENGVDTSRFRPDAVPWPRAQFGIADAAIVFGAAMRLTEQKNPLGLVEAFALVAVDVARAVLVIAGDGPLRAAIQARAVELGIADRVHLIGARDDLQHFYPMLDVFVLPSVYEGLPLALLEAMAAERPSVATAVGEIPQVVAGLPVVLIQPGDGPALVHGMREALARISRSSGLRERVERRYSTTRMASSYAQLYADLWRNRGRAAA
jgi:glycosyltransferase involved in cell wall biosynthesis